MKKGMGAAALAALLTVLSYGQSGRDEPVNSGRPAPLIMGYEVAPGSGNDAAGRYPTNANLGYKGVVLANFDAADDADEIVADFGPLGLWFYNNGIWTRLSALDPERIVGLLTITDTDDEIMADFGPTGLWYWDGWSWFQISGADATGMFAADDDNDGIDDLQVDFGPLGVWRYDFDELSPSNWRPISGLDPYYGLRSAFNPDWTSQVWSFPSVGIWDAYITSYNNAPYYTQLTGTATGEDDFACANFIGTYYQDLVADFGGLGLWLYKGSYPREWVKISELSVNRVKEVRFVGGGTRDYELLIQDNATLNLYWGDWKGTGFVWKRIPCPPVNPLSFCETFDLDGADGGDEEAVIPLAEGGCVLFDYSAGEAVLSWLDSNWPIHFLVKGDYYGRGYDSTMAFVFGPASGSPGLWLYEKGVATDGGWTHIANDIPDGLY